MLYICPNCGKWIKSREVPDRCPACFSSLSGTWPFYCGAKRKTWWLYFALVITATFFVPVYMAVLPDEIDRASWLCEILMPVEFYIWVVVLQPWAFLYSRIPGLSEGRFGTWEYFWRGALKGCLLSLLYFGAFDILYNFICCSNEVFIGNNYRFIVAHLPNLVCFVLSVAGIVFPHLTRYDLMYETMIFPIESSHVAYSWIFLRWLPMAVAVFYIAGGIKAIL